MNDKGLYRKVGGKYIPASEDDVINYLRDGFYLLHKDAYGLSVSPVIPDKVSVSAAMKLAKDAMVAASLEASKLKPRPSHGGIFTTKEKRAYAAYEKIMGKRAPAAWIGESIYGVIDAGIKVLDGHISKDIPPPF